MKQRLLYGVVRSTVVYKVAYGSNGTHGEGEGYIDIHLRFIGFLLTCSLSMMNREIRWIGVRVRVHVDGFVSSFFSPPPSFPIPTTRGTKERPRKQHCVRARSTAARLSLPVPSGVLQLLPAHRRCESISFFGEFFGRDIRGVFPGGLPSGLRRASKFHGVRLPASEPRHPHAQPGRRRPSLTPTFIFSFSFPV